MTFLNLIRESVGAIRANIVRSALTVVGIIVGIFSVTAMLSLGDAVSNSVVDRFSSFGSSDLVIQGDLTQEDYRWINKQPYIENTYASVGKNNVDLVVDGEEYKVSVNAIFGDYIKMRDLKVSSGEVYDFRNIQYSKSDAVIDANIVESLEENGQKLSIGDIVYLDDKKYNIIAISDSETAFAPGAGSMFIPYAVFNEYFSSDLYIDSINTEIKNIDYLDLVSDQILGSLNVKRSLGRESTDLVSVSSSKEFIETIEETTFLLNIFLVIIGGISLFVGGVGTMNMMLTTVSERTKEIGLRKAIGAHGSDILTQILLESAFITFIGGIIGILLSYIIVSVANIFVSDSMGINLLISGKTLLSSVSVSILIGLVFGYYPAKNAAALQPVDALRSE